MPTDVLLVNPNRIRPPIAPLALEYLAHALARAGLSWRVADLCLADDPESALAAGLADSPLLIAITFRNTDDCYCATQHSFIPDLQELVEHIRRCTDAPIVLGGAGFSAAPAGVLRRTGAEFGIVGDGERPLVELVRALRNQSQFGAIPGLVWREGEDFRANPAAWQAIAQDPLPRTALDNERYFREGGQAGIETKRGCPARCVYCADPLSKGSGTRTRPPAAIAEEMLSLASRGVDVFHTCDSEFNSDVMHAVLVCEELIRRSAADRLRWYAYCAPTPFPPELARLMRQAGCVGINFGTDGGDAEMLRRLGRDHAPDDIVAAVRACREHGIVVMLDLLLGSPGETPQSVARSIQLVRETGADCAGAALGVRLYANTPLAERLRARIETGERTGLRGDLEGNSDLAMPVFYLAPELGDDPVGLLRDLIAGDQRFFFGWPDDTQADYNYDDNPELVEAIRAGHRGAYWDILRRLRGL